MFRLFEFLESVNWAGGASFRAPPLPEVQARIAAVASAVEETDDIAAFLARVYRNQQC